MALLAMLLASPYGRCGIVNYTDEVGTQWQINTSDGTAMLYYMVTLSRQGRVALPDMVTYENAQYKITRIGKNANIGSKYLTEILFGRYVEAIDSGAFSNNEKLAVVTLPANLKEIGSAAFASCPSLKTIEFPSHLDSIGDYVFRGSALESFNVTAGMTKIGKNPVRGCKSLASISVAAANPRYTAADGFLFSKDKSLLIGVAPAAVKAHTMVPSSVKRIGDYAFAELAALENVTLPGTLNEIGEMAFSGCSLKSIAIPGAVNSIKRGAFSQNPALTQITVDAGNTSYKIVGNMLATADGKLLVAAPALSGDVSFPAGVEKLGDFLCSSMKGITSVNLSGIKELGDNVFYRCEGIATVNFGNTLEKIGRMCFQRCSMLRSVTLPASLKSTGFQSFTYCSSLNNLEINEGIETLGDLSFYACTALTSVKVPGSVKHPGRSLFYSCSKLRNAELGEGIEEIPTMMFAFCSQLRSINFPSTLKGIGNGAFEACSLTKAELPEGLEYVGDMVFENNKLTGAVSVPNSVKSIGAYAYAFNNNMTSFTCGTGLKRIERLGICASEKLATVKLNEGLEFIGEQALCNLALTEITIPSTVDTVEKGAFENNPLIGDFYLRPTTPPATTGDIVLPNTQFNGIIIHPYQEATLHVPVGAVEAYRNAPIWGKFTEIIGDINAVGEISGDNAEIKEIYDLEGRRLPAIQPGKINICIMTDGTVRKIMAPVSE